jgi:hypothetical protein
MTTAGVAKHRHHLVPRYAGGADDASNLTPPISIRLHAMFHFDRWRHVGDVRDYAAYRTLLGQMSGAAARYLVMSELLRGRKYSGETLARMSAAQRRRAAEGRMSRKSPEARQRQSEARKGRRDLIAAAIAKVAEANRSRVWSDASKARLGQSHRRYWAQMGVAERERRRCVTRAPINNDTREKLRRALKGRRHSEITKYRLRVAAEARVTRRYKLTEDQAMDVKFRAWKGERHAEIAREFGITEKYVGGIVRGETWRRIGHVGFTDLW